MVYTASGQGVQLFKADIKNAFKLIPVRPEQWRLLGFQWLGKFYYQFCLPFGGRSSPGIFNDFADCLQCLCQENAGDVATSHYLDHFFRVGTSGDSTAAVYHSMQRICKDAWVCRTGQVLSAIDAHGDPRGGYRHQNSDNRLT